MNTTSRLTALTLAALGVALVASTSFAGPRGDDMGMRGDGPFMSMDFAALDADKDGKVTLAEIEAFRTARLTAADADGDGFLNAEEVQAMMLVQMQTRAADMAAKMIARQDRDGDGKLSMAEMAPRSPQERMFDRVDTDGDGALSAAEMDAAKAMMNDRREGRRGGKDGQGRSTGGMGNQNNK